MRLVFDIESDGLLHQLTKVHCIVVTDVDTEKVYRFRPSEIEECLRFIMQATDLIAHNGIKFDVPAIKKVYPWFDFKGVFHDTLVYTRLLWPNIGVSDAGRVLSYRKSNGASGLPPKLTGSHSLKAWGYRLGIHKGTFGETSDWQYFSEEMLSYCEQDVAVNLALWRRIEAKIKSGSVSQFAIEIEHKAAWVLAQQERNGFKFNTSKAVELYSILADRREKIKQELVDTFGTWYVSNGVVTPKKSINYKDPLKGDRVENAPYTRVTHVQFNPASRDHIAKVLIERGWQPTVFTDGGKPKIDEDILEKLDFPEAKLVSEFFMLNKRIGQLAEGNQGWLNCVTPEGFIHGSVNPNGAVTGRATHAFPNIAQVPSAKAAFGHECRDLFTVPAGWVLLGSDASGLELRCLGHFMAQWDNGNYIKVILEGDIHTENQKAAKLATRDEAKRFIYAFLYGAGDELIGQLVGYTEAEYLKWKAADAHVPIIAQLKKRGERYTRERICHILKGKQVKKQFLKGLPALKHLINWVKAEAKEKGYVTGLDGRQVFTRSAHSALNTLLQSAGALICKLWIIRVNELAQEAGLKHGWDGDYAYCAWVHDELQVACRTGEIAEKLGAICKAAIKDVGDTFKFNCPLDAEFATGTSWRYTH